MERLPEEPERKLSNCCFPGPLLALIGNTDGCWYFAGAMTKSAPLLFLLAASLICAKAQAQTNLQRSWSNWVGAGQGITFRFGSPQVFGTFNNQGGVGLPIFASNYYDGRRAVAYSDSITGNIKFIATPRAVYSRNWDTVTNGYGLIACGDDTRHGIQVIPFPGGENKFYIIHNFIASPPMGGMQTICSVYGNATGATPGTRYSILDMDRNNGLGAIVSKNNPFPGGGRMLQVRHANGRDLWVVGPGTTGVGSTLISPSGIAPANFVNISFPTDTTVTTTSSGFYADASPHGNRIAIASGNSRTAHLINFDPATGSASYHSSLVLPFAVSGLCFSPDGTKLYVSTYRWNACPYSDYRLYQVNLVAANPQERIYELASDRYQEFNNMQRIPGNRIMISGRYESGMNFAYSLHHLINQPNQPGPASLFRKEEFTGPGNTTHYPLFPNDVVKQAPEAPITDFNFPMDTALCLSNFTLQAPAGYEEYRWSNGSSGQTLQVTRPGVYTVLAGPAGFTRPTGFGYIRVRSLSQPLDLGPDTLLCPKDTFRLSVPSNFSNVLWNSGSTSHDLSITTLSSGPQVVTAVDGNGCFATDSICVSFRYTPRASFGPDTVICTGENLLLRMEPRAYLSPGAAYLWNTGATTDTLRVTQSGTYWGRASYQGCTDTDTIQVTVRQAPLLDAGRDTTLCFGNTLELRANIDNATYFWNTRETTQSIQVQYSDDYWVKVHNGSCWAIDTVKVRFMNPPYLNLGPDRTVCEGASINFNLHLDGATFLWQDGSTSGNYSITTAGTYWVRVNYYGCIVTDTLHVQQIPKPSVNLGADTILCTGESLTLNAAGPGLVGYLWQNGHTGPTRTINSGGDYWVRVQGTNGCYAYDTISVGFRYPALFSLGEDKVVCPYETVSYSFNTEGQLLWSTGSTSNSISITQPGLYWLEINRNGCRRRDTVLITHKPLPVVNLGRDTTLCEGTAHILDATNTGATYVWQDGQTGATYRVERSGDYHVRVNLNGCISRDTARIIYHSMPRPTLGRDTVICAGSQIQLVPGTWDGTYTWQDGTGTPNYLVSTAGTYTISITNVCGTGTDEVVIAAANCDPLMPNAFTPDGDGRNDLFRVKFPQFFRAFRLTVFDRRGTLLYQTSTPGAGWDGTLRGRQLPTANYVWRLEYTDLQGRKDTRWGTVLLIR
jgi:gliding motility-associated-like protein